jgi:hypothetical protein
MSQARLNIPEGLDLQTIEAWVADPDLAVIQTPVPLEERVWALLNEAFFSRRPDVELRVYGFYGSECDLSFVGKMPNVEKFVANCLMKASGVESVAALPRLQTLGVGVYEMQDFGFLDEVHPGIQSLSLEGTFSKKPRIHAISRFRELKRLYLEGQQKGLEAISDLSCLEDLTLRSITVPSLDFLPPLKKLWSLDIKLGGTRNLEVLREMPGIKYLELWQIQKFEDLSPVAEMAGLQNLFLQSLSRIRRLPDLSRATSLRRIVLEGMKGLETIAEAGTAPNLEDLALLACPQFDPLAYEPLFHHRSLRRMLLPGVGGKKQMLVERMKEKGIQPIERLYGEEAFVYR